MGTPNAGSIANTVYNTLYPSHGDNGHGARDSGSGGGYSDAEQGSAKGPINKSAKDLLDKGIAGGAFAPQKGTDSEKQYNGSVSADVVKQNNLLTGGNPDDNHAGAGLAGSGAAALIKNEVKNADEARH